jgi:hypothetical protein
MFPETSVTFSRLIQLNAREFIEVLKVGVTKSEQPIVETL